VTKTPIWQLSHLPAVPLCCRRTPAASASQRAAFSRRCVPSGCARRLLGGGCGWHTGAPLQLPRTLPPRHFPAPRRPGASGLAGCGVAPAGGVARRGQSTHQPAGGGAAGFSHVKRRKAVSLGSRSSAAGAPVCPKSLDAVTACLCERGSRSGDVSQNLPTASGRGAQNPREHCLLAQEAGKSGSSLRFGTRAWVRGWVT
jgi:hypothetical protein